MQQRFLWLALLSSLAYSSCKRGECLPDGCPAMVSYVASEDSICHQNSAEPLYLQPYLVVNEHPAGLFAFLNQQEICQQKFYCDAAGKPVCAVYSQQGFPDECLRFVYTDSSVIVREGRSGRCEYLFSGGLIVARRSLGHGSTTHFSYDAARHLVSAGQTDYVWEGARLLSVQLKSPDGSLMIERKVDYDAAKPVSQVVMAELFAHYWGKWWLLPFLQKGYFGEFPVDVPYKVSYPDGHFDLFRSTFDDDNRLTSLLSVADGKVRDFRWADCSE